MKNRKLITLVVLALVLVSLAWTGTSLEAKKKIVGTKMFAPFWNYLVLKPIAIRYGLIILPLKRWLDSDGTSFVKNFNEVILYNPPKEGILPFLNILLKILLPIYSLLIVLIGFYLLLLSSSPEGRTNAKSMLSKLIITMIMISISPYLIEIIFTISRDLTKSIFSLSGFESIREILNGGIGGMFTLATWLTVPDVELGTIPFILVHVLAWMPYMIISMRNIILTALMILFPLGIILYFIHPLKSIGKTILEQFLIWTFIQAFTALALVSVVKAYSVTTLVPNPTLNCVQLPIFSSIPFLQDIIEELFGSLPSGTTDLMTLGFGLTAYIVVIISPIVMVMLFRKFLP